MKLNFAIVCIFLPLTSVFAQQNTLQRDPTIALENFDFKAIDYTKLDSTSCDYIHAIEHSLYHRFDQAEVLMKRVSLCSDSPLNKAARHYLLNELYFWRGKYVDYVQFSNQTSEKQGLYELAKTLVAHPAMQVNFSADSLQIPVTIQKHSYIIANVRINGKSVKLLLDTGAQFSVISRKLSTELKLRQVSNLTVTNSVNTTFQSSVGILDSLSFGNVNLTDVPVIYTTKSKIFKRMDVDGLLGWDILQKLTYTTDFKEHTLLIHKPVIDTTTKKNLFGISQPLILIHESSGNQLNMFFDSGSDRIDLTMKGAEKLGKYSTKRRLGIVSGVGKTSTGFFRYVKDFAFYLNRYMFTRKRTYLTPVDGFILNVKRDGILSNAPFQKGRLTIDYLNNHFDYCE